MKYYLVFLKATGIVSVLGTCAFGPLLVSALSRNLWGLLLYVPAIGIATALFVFLDDQGAFK